MPQSPKYLLRGALRGGEMDPDITGGRKNKGLGQHPGEHRDLGGKWRRLRRKRQVSGGECLPQCRHLLSAEKVPSTSPGFSDCEHRWPGAPDLTKASKVVCSSSHSISSSLLYSGSVLSAPSLEAGLLPCNSVSSSLLDKMEKSGNKVHYGRP